MGFEFKTTKLPKIEPGYITGKKAFEIRDRIDSLVEKKYNSNSIFKVSISKSNGIDYLTYRSFFDLFIINEEIKKEGYRVAEFKDQDLNEYIPQMFGDYKSLDFPELIVQSPKVKERQKKIFSDLENIIKKKEGEIKYPFKISGLELKNISSDKGGYGLTFMAKDNNIKNVKVSHSDSLKYGYNIQNFSTLDSFGNPVLDINGDKKIYLNRYGISPVSTNKKLEFDAGCSMFSDRGNKKIVMIVRNRPRYKGEPVIK